jgi:enoyl-CoA hydratase/carnithine racemase
MAMPIVKVVWLDNPPVNAVTNEMLESIERALEEPGEATRVLVLRGRGERAFSVGADVTAFADGDASLAAAIQRTADAIEASPIPVLAAIQGYCLGGGLELAMACDFRIAAEDAQLGQPEIKLGLIPGGGGTQRLPRLVGHGRALYLNLTGDPISGSQAYDWGLVEKVVPRDGLLDAALELARTLAQRSPFAMGVIKELAAETRDLPLSEGLRREAQGFIRCIGSADGAEGVVAFLEKRQPEFTGR